MPDSQLSDDLRGALDTLQLLEGGGEPLEKEKSSPHLAFLGRKVGPEYSCAV